MRKYLLIVAVAIPGYCHDVITTKITYSREVIRIFSKRCISCHHEGGKTPMSLQSYTEARPWAKAIKEEILERRMPPWGAVKGFGVFKEEQALSQEEISILADWVEGGAPEGDPKFLPPSTRNDPSKPKASGAKLEVSAETKLLKASRLLSIQPRAKADVANVRVVAEQPDGSVEPLIWLKNYKAQWTRLFEFRQPLAMPAGTTIRVEPPGQAGFVVYLR